MPLPRNADVVVVGFGVAGAAAALAAARAGARVTVLDRGVPTARPLALSRSARSRRALRSGLQRAALAAGVAVHPRCHVHELMMDAGRVCGVGYAAPPSDGGAATARLAETIVGEVGCSSVVLALDPRHWEFVGPAVWSAARASGDADGPPPTARPSPELAVRTWCAAREAGAAAASRQAELGFDAATGAVLMGAGLPVPGLYSAVGGRAADPAAGHRAGRGAALETARRSGAELRSVI
ncbi:FAD-binding protein [Actinomadura rugatobispora]|uniref:FAD-binding protein n=1 Tax=Actinomadura rugatobispora TaxID=1994 RepID=A0ABW0ZX43_9ACTN|nr:hypothetical protein GCM10010200_110400 [Actinomadura rugatobispora]